MFKVDINFNHTLLSSKFQIVRINIKHLYGKVVVHVHFAVVLTSNFTLKYYRFDSLTISLWRKFIQYII